MVIETGLIVVTLAALGLWVASLATARGREFTRPLAVFATIFAAALGLLLLLH